ncbi:MAG: GspH/FimT family pseudopilin [Pseudomonadota bacterium]
MTEQLYPQALRTGRQPIKMAGFTLVELLIALTILSIMMLFAVPAFNDFTQQRRMTTNVNSLVAAINYARSEATRRGGLVTVQANDATDANDEWGAGFCVTADDPGDCTNPLQVFALNGTPTFDATGTLDSVDGFSYDGRGLKQDGFTGTLRLCGADATDDPGRVISINVIGRATVRQLVCFP